jgi:hypothetical protein
MAAMPCALAARNLVQGEVKRPGSATAYEFFEWKELLDQLVHAGFVLRSG